MVFAGFSLAFTLHAFAQNEPPPRENQPPPSPPGMFPRGPDGPGGPGGISGPGNPGGPMGQERKVFEQFDADDDGQLNAEERKAAREFIKADQEKNPRRGPRSPGSGPGPGPGTGSGGGFGPGGPDGPGGPRGPGGPGFPGGPGAEAEPVKPGPHVSPTDVKNYPQAPFYDPEVLRTIFIDFDSSDWEVELADFHNTDVELPATLTVDGARYPNVGVHFRGASSYMMVGPGHKRSFNISMDCFDPKQNLYGERTLNLLNGHGDPSLMSTVIYSHLARRHIPAPQANFARVVINGESWGVYVSVEQFNKDFIGKNFPSSSGARWKVKGSPQGDAGLNYLGDDLEQYQRRYQIKSKDEDQDWRDLIELTRVLSETPLDDLEAALKPMLDIEGTLWFLALDIVLANSDGYWTRASDYNIYQDPQGVFHIIPHDMNEAFHGSLGGPGFGRGPRGGGRGNAPGGAPGQPAPPPDNRPMPNDAPPPPPPGSGGGSGGGGGRAARSGYELDPLFGMNDLRKPLRSRLLAVPALRARYLEHVRTIAEQLSWETLGPFVAQNRQLIEDQLRIDTRKLSSFESFQRATSDEAPPDPPAPAASPTTGPDTAPPNPGGRNLRTFADRRRAYLLNYRETAPAPTTAPANEAKAAPPKNLERAP